MKLQMLLVVIDPTKQAQPALERAAWVARKSGAALELLVCEYHVSLEGSSLFDRKSRETAREQLLQERLDWLESLAQPLRNEGLRVQTAARWGRPLHRVVLERAAELQPDLLFKAASEHGELRQMLLGNSCWELIRHATVPLWLVHPHRQPSQTLIWRLSGRGPAPGSTMPKPYLLMLAQGPKLSCRRPGPAPNRPRCTLAATPARPPQTRGLIRPAPSILTGWWPMPGP